MDIQHFSLKYHEYIYYLVSLYSIQFEICLLQEMSITKEDASLEQDVPLNVQQVGACA